MEKREVVLNITQSLIGGGSASSITDIMLTAPQIIGKYAATLYNTVYCNICLPDDCPPCCTCNKHSHKQNHACKSSDDLRRALAQAESGPQVVAPNIFNDEVLPENER